MKSAANAFESIRVAGFDAFLQAAEACFVSRDQIEGHHLREHVAHIQQFRRQLEANFVQADPLRPRTALYLRCRPPLKDAFEAFRQGMRKVEKFLSGRPPEYLQEGCREAAEALATLREVSQALSIEESAFPRPENPIDELLAMIEFIAQGQLDMNAMVARAEDFRSRCRGFREDVSIWSKGKSREQSLVGPTDRACRHLLEIERTLEALVRYGRGEQLLNLSDLQQQLRLSGEELRADHEEIMRLVVPPIPCPQCGHINDNRDKVCQSCAAKLPELVAPQPASTFSAQEGMGEARPRLAYLVQVEDAIETYLTGEADLSHLQAVSDWFAQRVNVGVERYKQLQPPMPLPDVKEASEAEAVKATFEKGSAALQSCARDLQRYMASMERELLSRALESLRLGESLMGEAQQKMRRR